MSAYVPVDLNVAQQTQPWFIFRRFQLLGPRISFTYRLDYGFGYLLRRLVARWPTTDVVVPMPYPAGGPAAPTALCPQLNFELFDKSSFKTRQDVPIPLTLISTPGRNFTTLTNTEPAPVDAAALNVSFTAGAPTSFKILNYLFPYGSTIQIDITGQNIVTGLPGYCDLLLTGYYIPEKSVAMWGPKNG